MREHLLNLAIALALLMLVSACLCRSDRASEDRSNRSANKESVAAKKLVDPQRTDSTSKPDNGDFVVEHLSVSTPKYVEIDRQVKAEKLLEKAADRLNRSLSLAEDITLRTKDCEQINAFYSADDHSVTMCYELMEHFYRTFKTAGNSEDAAYKKMFDAVRFVFLHEIAHALIDQYKLPVAGNEEDAADRCSAYINLKELGDEGVRAVFAAADAFQIESKHSDTGKANMADEHLLQEQRFYNSLCMIYGSDPSKYSNIVSDGYLPKERAVRCQTEYQRAVDSWVSLLEPWRKE